MFRIICLIIGYAIGCVQTAYIVGKLTAKIDIRDYGSGNAGTTNIVRVLGAKAGLAVFFADVFKGALGFMLCSIIFSQVAEYSVVAGMYGGIGVILGHNFPFYLQFKGGKGIASWLGITLCTYLPMALIMYIIGIITVVSTKYISLASLILTLLFPIMMYLFKFPIEAVVLGAALTILSYYQHRANIKRLLNGTENKFSPKEKGMIK